MMVPETSPLKCPPIRSISTTNPPPVASIQNRKSMTKAVSRSPLLATSTSRTTPSGLMISRRLRFTPSRKRLIRSRRRAIAGTSAVGEEIDYPEHTGGKAKGETCRRIADQLPETAFDDAGDENHQHRATG